MNLTTQSGMGRNQTLHNNPPIKWTFNPIRSRHPANSNSTEQPNSLPWLHYYCSVVEEEAERTEEHKQEDIAGDIPAEEDILAGDIPAGDIPEADKRLWHIPPVDNLEEEEHQLGVVAGCNSSWLLGVLIDGCTVGWNIIKVFCFRQGRRETGDAVWMWEKGIPRSF